MPDEVAPRVTLAIRTRIVTSAEALSEASATALAADVVAVDVEADGLYAYRPRPCTVQIAWRASDAADTVDVAVIDALATGLQPLARVLAATGPVKLLHDLTFDARLLSEAGLSLARVRDTSVAARLLGFPATGLAALLESELGVRVDKRFQQHDWSQRPLAPAHIEYLARDVAHLFALDVALCARAAERDVTAEIADECDYKLATALAPPRDSRPAYARIKGARDLDAVGRAVLRHLVDVRERAAERANVPPFKVVGSEVLLELARVRPGTPADLARIRGASAGRAARLATGWLDAIAAGIADGDVPPGDTAHFETVRLDRATAAKKRALTDAITKWRRVEAKARGVDEQAVLPGHCAQDLVDAVWDAAPDQAAVLARITGVPGIGRRRLERYGESLAALAVGCLTPKPQVGSATP